VEGEVARMSDGGKDNVGARNGALVETLEGRFVDVLHMNPEEIRIEEIAHSLAMMPRFGGFMTRAYSVAEHSIYVARLVRRMCEAAGMNERNTRRTVRQALLHDAPEYVLPDMAYTIKYQPEFAFYRELDGSIWRQIAARFDVPVEMHPFIHEVDKRMATTEKLLLKGPHMPPHWAEYARQYPAYVGAWDIIDRFAPEFEPSWRQIKRRFLDFYETVREA
jgi:uncharacterized protein